MFNLLISNPRQLDLTYTLRNYFHSHLFFHSQQSDEQESHVRCYWNFPNSFRPQKGMFLQVRILPFEFLLLPL